MSQRTKIDYGIDLGTTNSAISRLEDGIVVIKKTDSLKDTMPSCVSYNRKRAVTVGDMAYNRYLKEMNHAACNEYITPNTFKEFKRTLGTDKYYYSSYLDKNLSSEELSSEVLKKLKSFINDEVIDAVVITIPAAFTNNQKEATREAARMAGFKQIELLQEPVAAAMFYGLQSPIKNGDILVFDFGGGTFDAALLRVNDGIIKVVDTAGDNYLGGKNLDAAIVTEIILPELQHKYAMQSYLEDDDKKLNLINAMRAYAEQAKIQLSFNEITDIYSDLDESESLIDDDGEIIELDMTISRELFKEAVTPIFQKAIDICKELLERNHLSGSDLAAIQLVGGPTISPILQDMLKEQLKKPDASIDPMTVVSKGAALYASTIDIIAEISDKKRDHSKTQLVVKYEPSSVELNEMVTIKVDNPDYSNKKLYAEIIRSDKASTTGKKELTNGGEIFDVYLLEGKTNQFDIRLFDEQGTPIPCEPNRFSIIQGSKIGNSVLAYCLGIAILDQNSQKEIFRSIKGLEKNTSIPAQGTVYDLKTSRTLDPNNSNFAQNHIKIPLYEGDYDSNGSLAQLNEHISDIIIDGKSLDSVLPAGSDVTLTISYSRSEQITVKAYFPYLDCEVEISSEAKKSCFTNSDLKSELNFANQMLVDLKNNGIDNSSTQKLERELEDINHKVVVANDDDEVKMTISHIRKVTKKIDKLQEKSQWIILEKNLTEQFENIATNSELKGDYLETFTQLKKKFIDIQRFKDIKLAQQLQQELSNLDVALNRFGYTLAFLAYVMENFDNINFRNIELAQKLLNKAQEEIALNSDKIEDSEEQLSQIVGNLVQLMPKESQDQINNNLLIG